MSKNGIIILLGILVVIIPFLGFPGAWKTFFIVISGLVIAGITFLNVVRERGAPPKTLHQNDISDGLSENDTKNQV